MSDVMVDLETLGTVPGCAILSIGAVAFDQFGVEELGFYRAITSATCEAVGLHADADTLKWWEGQGASARDVLTLARDAERSMPLRQALFEFNVWLGGRGDDVRVWGNGADFDNPILAAAYRATGQKQGWKPYNGRCYRTVKGQYKDVKLVRGGTHHNALDDARSQAEHMVQICQQRGWRLA